jgi:hypothetical protein
VRQSSRYEYARAVAGRYRRASKAEKGRILEEFCEATGYARKYAIGLLRHPPPSAALGPPVRRPTRRRPRQYGPAEVALLRLCWELLDRICGKRLAPFLPDLLAKLQTCQALPSDTDAEVLARVAAVSPATIDRLLAPDRAQGLRRPQGLTKPGTLLKQQIPIKTFAEWEDTRPGFLEMDLVAHGGASSAGEFLFTLSTVDVATGWVGLSGVRHKGEYATFEALCRLRTALPFPLLGVDSDNGGEFINRSLFRYCLQEGITFTRGRPYHKNDNCHIEQKNWSVVRRLVGYARFELHALPSLNRVYTVATDYVNFFQPVRKLLEKRREGARVHKRYDQAQTPYQRLLATGVLPAEQAEALARRSAALNPLQLKLDLEAAQAALYAHAVRSDPYVRHR